jgi:hypothetical protein
VCTKVGFDYFVFGSLNILKSNLEKPSLHPAWDADESPRVLRPYDDRVYPGCTRRTYENLDFFDTILGRVIRELNSTFGVPKSTFIALTEAGIKCDSCGCMFSPDGYEHHITDKQCTNCHFAREGLFCFAA